ncbi:MAG TPA: hypothetical protein PLM98_06500, partial [Thiolinea sp.]|nr:hypothetical protein [Thiolinea sp.]
MKLKTSSCLVILSISLLSTGCASLILDKKLKRNDIVLSSIKIAAVNRSYFSIKLGKNPNKNIIFYFTGTGCHDPSINAASLFDNTDLNATVFFLLK